VITPDMSTEQARLLAAISPKGFAVEKVANVVQVAEPEEQQPDTGLKDKQNS